MHPEFNQQNVPAARMKAGSGHEGRLIESLNDRTIDGELAARERRSSRSRKQAILDQRQNLELFTQLAPVSFVDRILGPLEQLRIPDWTVIQGIGRDSANHVVRPKPVRQVG